MWISIWYRYHKQYFHGVSSTTGHYFYPPRQTKRGLSSANRQQILGMCHECEEWVGYSAVLGHSRPSLGEGVGKRPTGQGRAQEEEGGEEEGGKEDKSQLRVPTLWYKHAHKCHRHQTCKGAKGRKKGKKTLKGRSMGNDSKGEKGLEAEADSPALHSGGHVSGGGTGGEMMMETG